MIVQLLILVLEAMFFYLLILWAHSLRHRYGYSHFYALLGAITALMSWVTDAGVQIQALGITFFVGSTVFYTSLLLGVFVVYVFDGPHNTRIAISTVAAISILVPVVAYILHFQTVAIDQETVKYVPMPSLRINAASVVATLFDMLFLGIAWEFFGRSNLSIKLWLRSFLTLLGVMWLDVFLFATGAFAGNPEYLQIMKGTLLDRLVISIFALPFLYGYLHLQSNKAGNHIENRPVLAILMKVAKIENELSRAQQQIDALTHFLPICSLCKRFRDEEGNWHPIEAYIKKHSETKLSHSICPECAKIHYSDSGLT
jgi:uncharacterized PurR-regulated membrane protein YhhQ (DUF165 family)